MNTAAPLPVPDGPPEPQASRAPASAPEDGGAFAEMLAALGALPPPPTPAPQAEARTAAAEGTTAGSDSPGSTQTAGALVVPQVPVPAVAPTGDQLTPSPASEAHSTEASSPSQAVSQPEAVPASEAPAEPASSPVASASSASTPVETDKAIRRKAGAQPQVPQAPASEVPVSEDPVRPDQLPTNGRAPRGGEVETSYATTPVGDQGGVSQDDSEIVVTLGPRTSTQTSHDSGPASGQHDRAPGFRDEAGVFDRGGQRHLRDDSQPGARSHTDGPIGIDVNGPRFEVSSASHPGAGQALPVSSRLNELVDKTRATIRFAVRHGHTDARITLRPAELGEVRIALRYENGGVSAMLTAESSKSFEALAQAASDLRRSLEQSGVTVNSLEVRLGGDEARRDPNAWSGGAPFTANPLDAQLDDDEPEDEASDQSRPAAASGGVDVLA